MGRDSAMAVTTGLRNARPKWQPEMQMQVPDGWALGYGTKRVMGSIMGPRPEHWQLSPGVATQK